MKKDNSFMGKRQGSDSVVQRAIERILIERVKNVLDVNNLELNKTLYLKANPKTSIEPDFYSEEKRIIGEVHSHLGKLKPAQMNKVASDVLKMLLFEEDRGEVYNKYLVVCSKEEEVQLTGNSHVAQAIRNHNIKVLCFDIDDEAINALRIAMKEQSLINLKE